MLKKVGIFLLALTLFLSVGQVYAEDIGPDTVLGETEVYLDGSRDNVRTGETNLGNLIADILRYYGEEFYDGADIGLQHAGGIRASLEEGEITVEDVLEVYTFANYVTTVELKGAEVLEVLEHSVSYYPDATGGFLQVSGISFSFDPSQEPGDRIVEVLVDGEELDLEDNYFVATNNFIVRGSDGYDVLGNVELSRLQNLYSADFITMQEALIEYFQEFSPINIGIENRINIIE